MWVHLLLHHLVLLGHENLSSCGLLVVAGWSSTRRVWLRCWLLVIWLRVGIGGELMVLVALRHGVRLVFGLVGHAHGGELQIALSFGWPSVAVCLLLDGQVLVVAAAVLLRVVDDLTEWVLLILLVIEELMLVRRAAGSRRLFMLLLLELLQIAAIVWILLLVWVAVLGRLMAVGLASHRVGHEIVGIAVHHHRGRGEVVLLSHVLVEWRSLCVWRLELLLMRMLRIMDHTAASLRLRGRHSLPWEKL